MLRVHQRCDKLIPNDSGSHISLVKTKLLAWRKRDDIEADIVRLKEHVMMCYTKFAVCAIETLNPRIQIKLDFTQALTAARTENMCVRTEHARVVNHAENQTRTKNLEILFTRMILDTQFGQQVAQQVEITITHVSWCRLCRTWPILMYTRI